MATAQAVLTHLGESDQSFKKVTWNLTTANYTGQVIQLPEWNDRSFQVEAANFGGATLEILGSNDGTNFRKLSTPATPSNTLTFTEAGGPIIKCEQTVAAIMPKLTAVGVDADITITAILHRPTTMRT